MSNHRYLREGAERSVVARSMPGALIFFLLIAGCMPIDETPTTLVVEVLETRLVAGSEELPSSTTSSVGKVEIPEESPTTTSSVGRVGVHKVPSTVPSSLPLGRPCVPMRPCVK